MKKKLILFSLLLIILTSTANAMQRGCSAARTAFAATAIATAYAREAHSARSASPAVGTRSYGWAARAQAAAAQKVSERASQDAQATATTNPYWQAWLAAARAAKGLFRPYQAQAQTTQGEQEKRDENWDNPNMVGMYDDPECKRVTWVSLHTDQAQAQAATTQGEQRTLDDYLNPERVMALAKKCSEPNAQCKHRIKCYYNGLYWACPNPYNKHKAKGVEEAYNSGYFFKTQTFPLSDEDFQDDKNWNS